MKLLVDQNIARRVAVMLCDAGHDAVHVSDRGLSAAEDSVILELARSEGRIIVSEDRISVRCSLRRRPMPRRSCCSEAASR